MWDALKLARLDSVASRFGLDVPRCWDQLLSGGERQRLGFARLYYHGPAFAFMDESMSAVDVELEQELLQTCVERGIAMVAITQRMSSLSLYDHVLRFHVTSHAWVREPNEPHLVHEERGRAQARLDAARGRVRRLSATPLDAPKTRHEDKGETMQPDVKEGKEVSLKEAGDDPGLEARWARTIA
jgi:ABC-type multidrug transport system ATPase subunit